MKKLLLLFFTLFLIGGSKIWGTVSFDSNKYYYIVEVSTGRYVSASASGEGVFGLHSVGKMGDKFLFTEVSSGVFKISNTDGIKLGATHSWNTTNADTEWTIEEVENETNVYTLGRYDNANLRYLNYQTGHPNSIYTDRNSKTESDTHKIKFYIVEGLLPANKFVSVSTTKANTFTASSGGTNYWYVMTQKKGGESPMYDDATNQQIKRASTSTVVSGSTLDNDKYLVRFVATGTGDSYYLQFATGNYVYSPNPTTQSDQLKSHNTNATMFMVYNITGENTHIGWNVTSDGATYGKRVDNNGAGSTVVLYDDGQIDYTDGNNDWYLYPVTLEDPLDLTYKVVYNGAVLDGFDTEAKSIEGLSFAAPSSLQRDGVTFTYYSEAECENQITTVSSENTTIYAKATYSLSSLISADTDHLSWFRLAAYSNSQYYDLYYNGTAPYPYKAQSAFDGSDGYFWAFVGDPFNGFKVYNKAVATTNTMIYNNTTNPVMGTDDGTKWYISLSDGKIGFQYTGNTGYRWNDYGGGAATLKYYGSESWHQYTNINDVDYSGLVESNIQPYIDNPGSGYFQITSDYASAFSAAIDEAEEDETIDLSEYQTLLYYLNGAIKWPTTGYYRVMSNSASTRLKAENESQLVVGGDGTEASSIVYLDGSRGTYTMQMQGQYVKIRANSGATYLGASSSNVYFTVPNETPEGKSKAVVSPGKVTIGGGQTATDFMRVDNSNVIGLAQGTNPTDRPAAYWTVEPATGFTINLHSDGAGTPTYYATGCWPFDVTISGANAYTLELSGSWLVPAAVTDNKVPAGTPVLLKGSNTTATATINTGDAFNSGSPLDCALTGTYVNKTIDGATDYVLGINGSVVGFYHWDSNDLGANRAYFDTPETPTPGVKGFIINWGDETGIENLNVNDNLNKVESIYNLAGQRVQKAQKGLYIVNGKKVLVK